MLRFNSFRSQRYLRSKFVEGHFLLASEMVDVELEILDLLRENVSKSLGDVAIDDAWKVEVLSTNQLLIKPGIAWFKGLPFDFRFGKDQLVSGSILSLGTVPAGVTIEDHPDGLGKIVNFNDGDTTPSNNYRFVITAKEELITTVQDPFLRNANLTEDTAQKIRLIFQLNIIPESLQTESPIPYRDENSISGLTTNFPTIGGNNSPNFINQIVVTPTSGGNGELLNTTLVSGSEGIDGRDVELTLRDNFGGTSPFPQGVNERLQFQNGKLIDSKGSVFHLNDILTGASSSEIVLRIDKESNQPNPEIVNNESLTLVKRDVFVQNNTSGLPQGTLHWPIANANWSQSLEFTHSSKVTDLRNEVRGQGNFQEDTNQKINLIPTGGGNLTFSSSLLTWTSDINVLNAFGPIQTIPANTVAIIEDGALIYDLDLENSGSIARGNLGVTILTAGSTITLNGTDNLTNVRLGNILRIGSEVVTITAINNVSKQLTVNPAIAGTGSATIYLDSFANQTAVLTDKSYVLATRKTNKVWVGGGALELEDGETNQLGDGITQAILTFLGADDENDASPLYTSTDVITQGSSLVAAISVLDDNVGDILDALDDPLYDERLLFPSGLTALTNITLPNNSRNSNNPQFYDVGSGELEIFHNQLFKFLGEDWEEVDNQTIRFTFDLPPDSEVHFRIDSISAGTVGGGGGGSLQDSYNIGSTINVNSGNPITINGPTGEKLLVINGDIDVTGVIDPTAIQFAPQSVNPLASGQRGLWINNDDELVFEDSTIGKNLSQSIDNLEQGLGVNALTRLMFNSTGNTIPSLTPVYSPSPGEIAPAHGLTNITSRVIGITTESIPTSSNGIVAYSGLVTGLSGFTHGNYLYLGDDSGELLDTEPSLGPFPSGFQVIIVGVIEGNNLILQIQNVGTL